VHGMPAMAPPCRPTSSLLHRHPCPPCQTTPPHPTKHARASHGRGEARHWPERTRPARRRHAVDVAQARALDTRRATTSSTPWPRLQRVEHRSDTATPLDTRPAQTRDRRRRRRRPYPVNAATVVEATRPNRASPDQAVAAVRLAWTHRALPPPRLAR
jgi:hypothetical protein